MKVELDLTKEELQWFKVFLYRCYEMNFNQFASDLPEKILDKLYTKVGELLE